MYTTFNRFEIKMTKAQANFASHQGSCDSEVSKLTQTLKSQLDKIDSYYIRKELKEYGAWDDEELKDDQANRERIVWIAAGNIIEECR